MTEPDGETLYILNGKRVDRHSFFLAAGRVGLTNVHEFTWETFYEKDSVVRQCLTSEYLFMTISPTRPCLN